MSNKNAVSWFEIPASDFSRAKKFYEEVFEIEMSVMASEETGGQWAMFPADLAGGGIGGAVVAAPGYTPNSEGAIVYLNGGDDLEKPLSKVEEAGGKVLLPKTSIGPNGFMAHFTDSEGNRLAMHSMG